MSPTKQYLLIGAAIATGTGAALAWVFSDKLFVIPKKRVVVTQHLKDSSSAEFRNERMTSKGWLCGELNSKNGFGAYNGFKRYVVTSDGKGYLGEEGNVVPDNAELTVAALDLQLERLKQVNAALRAGKTPEMQQLTEAQAFKAAPQSVFRKKWDEGCL